ncbi:hypothetical protein TIFTF001_026767 [Ficus carica]|uniref:Retrotransposon gag domain-containing protein n=1 Tax=Ficus carica TaxID=3494 RepID=A0AA88IYL8_FICCA|nr:hypothetical protein TIFTF001_026767 [Ficus carica]
MVRPRRTVPVNPPEPDLTTVVANLQLQLLEQQQETDRLREQIAQMNQRPQVNEIPRVPPVVPPMPEVQPEVPRALAGVQINPPLVREDLLYERFRRMKAPEFEGPTDPIAADNWLIDIQRDARHWWMIVQMRRDVTTMNWQDFVTEFRTMYYNREVLAAQQDAFTNLKQGSMTVMEAVKKFEQLARLCPELVPSETEKVRRMMKMFWTDISKQVSVGSSPPTLVSDCVSRAIRAEYWINQDKDAGAQIFKARKEEKAVVKQIQPRQIAEPFPKDQNNNPAQSFKQFGRNKRKGNFTGQGQQQRNYPQKRNNRGNEGNNTDFPMCAKCRRKHPGPECEQSTACGSSKD